MTDPVLVVDNLTLRLPRDADRTHAVRDLSFTVAPGETLGIVGESGSGKSLTGLAVMGLLPPGVRVETGAIRLAGRDLVGLAPRALDDVRGREIGMIFQEPMTSLDPVMRVGEQVAETFAAHGRLTGRERRDRVLALLEEVGLPDPVRTARAFPHELSGGQRQRVMIAAALALEPKVLVADEPTTALDVTTQAQILALIDDLRRRRGMAVILVTHDFGVVADHVDRVCVLQAGTAVESGAVAQVLGAPRHPYTRRLLAAVPKLGVPPPRNLAGAPEALRVTGLVKHYGGSGRWADLFGSRRIRAVAGVDIVLRRGEILGLVGESGSGKSTLGRCVLRLLEADAGSIRLGDLAFDELSGARLRRERRRIQMVFQDPFTSLNPRRTVETLIAEGPIAHGMSRPAALARARELLRLVGLEPEAGRRYPHAFSGGQRQRIGIARALALEPEILVADEPVSGLDVSVQEQILGLLRDLQSRLGLAVLFITHDLRVAAQLCDRVAVMRAGRIVEEGATADMFREPKDPYTRELLAAVPGRGRLG